MSLEEHSSPTVKYYPIFGPRDAAEKKAKAPRTSSESSSPVKASRVGMKNRALWNHVFKAGASDRPVLDPATIPAQPLQPTFKLDSAVRKAHIPQDALGASAIHVSTALHPQSRSISKSRSPTPAAPSVRFPTPISLGGSAGRDIDESDLVAQPSIPPQGSTGRSPDLSVWAHEQHHDTKALPADVSPVLGAAVLGTDTEMTTPGPDWKETMDTSPSSALSDQISSPKPEETIELEPIELVRVGTTILDRLLSDPVCKDFVNKVPQAVTNYHAVILKPMDLTTIENKLWKGLQLNEAAYNEPSTSRLVAAMSYISLEDGYSNIGDLEKDLQRIYNNATYFNAPTHPIFKQAQSFKTLFSGLLLAYREHRLIPNPKLPQELYNPTYVASSEPGPVYLFRAHLLKEMERKLTDISVDLYACLHQPLLDIMYGSQELSEAQPQFVRMYISKNRRLLANSRDERTAKIVLLSDVRTSKAFNAEVPEGSSTGAKMVRINARAMIAKPIGERHDMITVGDLDCPSAWTMIACIRAFDVEVVMPQRFDKGVLSKIRHEVVPFDTSPKSKLAHEDQRAFLDAMGLIPQWDTAASRSVSETVHSAMSSPSMQASPTLAGPAAFTRSFPPGAESALPPAGTGQESKADSHISLDGRYTSTNESGLSKAFAYTKPTSASLTLRAPIPTSGHSAEPSKPSTFMPTVTSIASSSSLQSSPENSAASSPSMAGSQATDSAVPRTKLSERQLSPSEIHLGPSESMRELTRRERQLLCDLKAAAREKRVPYIRWDDIEPSLTVDSAHGLFKRIYHVEGDDGLVIQNFKEMDTESFEQRVREVACLLKLRGLEGVGQIQSVIDDDKSQLVGLSMTKYEHTLKAFATNARRHPSPCQKLSLVRDMVAAVSAIHSAGLAHRDLSEVNIMVDEDPVQRLDDNTPRPWVRIIDFGKSVFVEREEVIRWSMKEHVPEEELALLPLVIVPPDHGYKLYRSILTLPRSKSDHAPLPPVDPRSEDVYSLGVLIWRTFSGKSPWNGAIEDDLKRLRYLVSSDEQIQFQLEREVTGKMSRALLLKCLTAEADTRWTAQQLNAWLAQPEVLLELQKEFEDLGGGRKKVRKNLD
ncbi:hypothetical protein BGZ72_001545 [Mortierella alpina]|nr:hypothetical protein BGZ72_001545 [Mortierella alpina]